MPAPAVLSSTRDPGSSTHCQRHAKHRDAPGWTAGQLLSPLLYPVPLCPLASLAYCQSKSTQHPAHIVPSPPTANPTATGVHRLPPFFILPYFLAHPLKFSAAPHFFSYALAPLGLPVLRPCTVPRAPYAYVSHVSLKVWKQDTVSNRSESLHSWSAEQDAAACLPQLLPLRRPVAILPVGSLLGSVSPKGSS